MYSHHLPSILPSIHPFLLHLPWLLATPAGYEEGDALNLSSKSDSRDDLSDAPTPRDDKDEALSDADDLDDKNGKLLENEAFMIDLYIFFFISRKFTSNHAKLECFCEDM